MNNTSRQPPEITIKNARENNLKGIDVVIPSDKITVITGPSGSGKSTLAMDILFSEGRRRYMEALGIEYGNWSKQPPAPLVDDIMSLPPAVALSQQAFNRNPRSTIFTFTGMARFARSLFGRCASIVCPDCGIKVTPLSVEEIVDELLAMPHGTRITLTAPLAQRFFLEQETAELVNYLRSTGFARIMIDGKLHYLDDIEPELFTTVTGAAIVVDRIINKDGIMSRVSDSVRLALRYGDGVINILTQDDRESPQKTVTRISRPVCPDCRSEFPRLSAGMFSRGNPAGRCEKCLGKGCDVCKDTGLAPFVMEASVHGRTFPEIQGLSVKGFGEWCEHICRGGEHNVGPEAISATRIASAMLERLRAFEKADLGYLSMKRKISSLSGGEFQKLRLASLLAKDLSGAMFILDEPSASIPASDFPDLWEQIKRLRQAGNTVVMVEHQPWFIKKADHVIELGPGAGRLGGRVLFQGTPEEMKKSAESVTAPWLDISYRHHGTLKETGEHIVIADFSFHSISFSHLIIPLNAIVCITGDTGSGKTALAETISRTLSNNDGGLSADKIADVRVEARIPPQAVFIDNMPAAASVASMPVGYMGAFTPIRRLFAGTPEARARGLAPAWFLLSRKGGRCETCKGRGQITVELDYMPTVASTCRLCNGARYNRDALTVKYKGMNMADILEMSVTDAASFFSRMPQIRKKLELLEETGLGYLGLGQPLSTLSGGESQRLRLARELSARSASPKLYIMDTPLKGLHPLDVEKLANLMRKLVGQGHSILVIEHREQMVASADHVIELSG